jgi:ubiquinone/menaquinone biosynthesis C-methylase UbiE
MSGNTERAGTSLNEVSLEGTDAFSHHEEPLRCLLCGSVRHPPVFQEFGVDILRCDDCGHIFSSFPSDPHYDGFWGGEPDDLEGFYWNQARVRMHEHFFRRFLANRSGRLLDMGCGLGFFVRSVATQTSWEAYGCEISLTAVRYARERLGLANVQQGRLEDVDFSAASFDTVTMWDVIDHIARPDAVLTRCYELLKPGGIFFLRAPNVRPQLFRARLKKLVLGELPHISYMMARDHCHYYSVDSLGRLLKRNGFGSVQFVHLQPIGSTTPTKDRWARLYKSIGFAGVRAVAGLSGGRLNFDNLFAVAVKGSEGE